MSIIPLLLLISIASCKEQTIRFQCSNDLTSCEKESNAKVCAWIKKEDGIKQIWSQQERTNKCEACKDPRTEFYTEGNCERLEQLEHSGEGENSTNEVSKKKILHIKLQKGKRAVLKENQSSSSKSLFRFKLKAPPRRGRARYHKDLHIYVKGEQNCSEKKNIVNCTMEDRATLECPAILKPVKISSLTGKKIDEKLCSPADLICPSLAVKQNQLVWNWCLGCRDPTVESVETLENPLDRLEPYQCLSSDRQLSKPCFGANVSVCGLIDVDELKFDGLCLKFPCGYTFETYCDACKSIEIKAAKPGVCLPGNDPSENVYICEPQDREIVDCGDGLHNDLTPVCMWTKLICSSPSCVIQGNSPCRACKDPNIVKITRGPCPQFKVNPEKVIVNPEKFNENPEKIEVIPKINHDNYDEPDEPPPQPISDDFISSEPDVCRPAEKARNVECDFSWKPVCGIFRDTATCVKPPCIFSTFMNRCMACKRIPVYTAVPGRCSRATEIINENLGRIIIITATYVLLAVTGWI